MTVLWILLGVLAAIILLLCLPLTLRLSWLPKPEQPAPCLLTDEEKGGVDAPLLQAIQQSGRILGRWPVIKGQCQIHRLRRSRSRQCHAARQKQAQYQQGQDSFHSITETNICARRKDHSAGRSACRKNLFATLRHFSELQKL